MRLAALSAIPPRVIAAIRQPFSLEIDGIMSKASLSLRGLDVTVLDADGALAADAVVRLVQIVDSFRRLAEAFQQLTARDPRHPPYRTRPPALVASGFVPDPP